MPFERLLTWEQSIPDVGIFNDNVAAIPSKLLIITWGEAFGSVRVSGGATIGAAVTADRAAGRATFSERPKRLTTEPKVANPATSVSIPSMSRLLSEINDWTYATEVTDLLYKRMIGIIIDDIAPTIQIP
jgi:hypothetical protein